MPNGRRPTTDTGTVVAHTVIVVSLAVLTLTGLRIASDDPAATWLRALDAVLPVEQLWFRHVVAGLALASALCGYSLYMQRARLFARVRFDRLRLATLARPGKPRWTAINVIIYWWLIAALLTEIGTGIPLFFEFEGPWLAIHLWATSALLVLSAAHVLVHARIGGKNQLVRIFKPAPLVLAPAPPDLAELLAEQFRLRTAELEGGAGKFTTESPGNAPSRRRRHPAALALAVGITVIIAAAEVESLTRPVLHIIAIASSEAPRIDGDLSDPVWAKTHPVRVVTTQGGDFGGTGVSVIEVRAVHDSRYAYFAFVWTDPTRSLKHKPLIKTSYGWKVATSSDNQADEAVYNEDKFSILLTRPVFPLIGAAIHLARAPLAKKPPSRTGRGLHYTTDGSFADCWVWRASHNGPGGHIDNAHFGPPEAENPTQRYAGGYSIDPRTLDYRANYEVLPKDGMVRPIRLPRSLAATTAALGRVNDAVDISESEGARWWLTESQSEPYSKAADNSIPVGAIIPGVIIRDKSDAATVDDDIGVRGVARWAAGRWTLEIVRRLYTGDNKDVPIKSGTLMWLAAFDHAETRHSRHLRPLRLEID